MTKNYLAYIETINSQLLMLEGNGTPITLWNGFILLLGKKSSSCSTLTSYTCLTIGSGEIVEFVGATVFWTSGILCRVLQAVRAPFLFYRFLQLLHRQLNIPQFTYRRAISGDVFGSECFFKAGAPLCERVLERVRAAGKNIPGNCSPSHYGNHLIAGIIVSVQNRRGFGAYEAIWGLAFQEASSLRGHHLIIP